MLTHTQQTPTGSMTDVTNTAQLVTNRWRLNATGLHLYTPAMPTPNKRLSNSGG
ncbi:MAG: hypothetical protein V7L05_29230 [Nostoc sp.]|uniref:hypothetical protein n=1 Tax=Nostoc sp. TaxID=1180 RepID=UPI002FF4A1FB